MAFQVHRHRDNIAVSLGIGETVYMTPTDARKLARAINRTARDIRAFAWLEQPHGSTIAIDACDRETALSFVQPR